MGIEKRKTERFFMDLKVRLDVFVQEEPSQSRQYGRTRDISSSGTFIRTDPLLPMNTLVDLEMVLPLDRLKKVQGDAARICLSGFVIRAEDQGIGIRFDEEYAISPMKPGSNH